MRKISRTTSGNVRRVIFGVLFVGLLLSARRVEAQDVAKPDAPLVKKVEPPNWWAGLTPDVMLLVYGKNLEVTHASCNLQDVIVSRTQATGGGDYLFVWLKFGAGLKSGTAVCRLSTAHGETSFELPIAARKQILGR